MPLLLTRFSLLNTLFSNFQLAFCALSIQGPEGDKYSCKYYERHTIICNLLLYISHYVVTVDCKSFVFCDMQVRKASQESIWNHCGPRWGLQSFHDLYVVTQFLCSLSLSSECFCSRVPQRRPLRIVKIKNSIDIVVVRLFYS